MILHASCSQMPRRVPTATIVNLRQNELAPELTFEKFLASLLARATALAKTRTPT